jgi:hypothetical protein
MNVMVRVVLFVLLFLTPLAIFIQICGFWPIVESLFLSAVAVGLIAVILVSMEKREDAVDP